MRTLEILRDYYGLRNFAPRRPDELTDWAKRRGRWVSTMIPVATFLPFFVITLFRSPIREATGIDTYDRVWLWMPILAAPGLLYGLSLRFRLGPRLFVKRMNKGLCPMCGYPRPVPETFVNCPECGYDCSAFLERETGRPIESMRRAPRKPTARA